MTVISLINQKGGCGKSTIAVHLVYWLDHQGKKVTLVDSDAQKTSSIWLKTLDLDVSTYVLETPDDVLDQLPKMNQQSEFVIVDGPAGLSEVTRAILLRSDVALVPCQPTGVDLRSASDAIRLIKQAQDIRNGLPKASIFLSRAFKGTRLKNEAIGVLQQTQIPLLKSVIHQRQVIADLFGQNSVVWNMGKSANESADEFENLFTEVMNLE